MFGIYIKNKINKKFKIYRDENGAIKVKFS